MRKNIITKAMLSCVAMICFGLQEVNAQQESSERELQVVSFKEADASDFDVTSPSIFSGELKETALVKVFMPGEIERTDPRPATDIKRQPSPGSGVDAFYVWVPQHTNILSIFPKGNTYQKVRVEFKEHGITPYTIKNKNGGLQAGKVYHLVLRDPTPVYVDTYLTGAYACIDNKTEKIYADNGGRITLRDLTYGEHVVNVFAGNGDSRGSVKIDDREKIYTLDARKKTKLNIKTNPAGGEIYIADGETEEPYDRNKEYAYRAYKVTAYINGNKVEKNITVDDNYKSFIIDNTKTYNITPMYMGHSASATVYENNKQLVESVDNGVILNGNTYQVTRPIGKTYKYYATNHNGKSPRTTVNVNNNSQSDYQLSIAARNSIVWPWEREYSPAPFGISAGYVQKQLKSNGEGEKRNENGIWADGDDKWLSGMQIGLHLQPCFSFGLGMYTGIFYEFYLSSNDNEYYTSYQEHDIYVPVHALFRLPFSEKVSLWIHGGLGFNYGVYASYSSDDEGADDLTDVFGEPLYVIGDTEIYNAKRLNMAAEISLGLRVGPVAVNATYSKGLNNHKRYENLGDYTTRQNKLSFSVSYVIGTK